MKTNSTLVFKCLFIVLMTLAFTKSFSATTYLSESPVINLKANVENNSLVINWNISPNTLTNYCEVQASEDGKTFSTIGFVMGADPKQGNNSFIFKQSLKKIKPGKVFYRILTVTTNDNAIASDVVKIAQ